LQHQQQHNHLWSHSQHSTHSSSSLVQAVLLTAVPSKWQYANQYQQQQQHMMLVSVQQVQRLHSISCGVCRHQGWTA
jgi:hypothetical protein